MKRKFDLLLAKALALKILLSPAIVIVALFVKLTSEEFAKGQNHINGIEGFWGVAKIRLAKFRGMSKNTFYLHLKECEFRYNYRKKNLYLKILKIVRLRPLF